MTFSSDGNAGVRRRDPATGEDIYRIAPLDKNLEQTVRLITDGGLTPSQAFSLITANPARNLKLTGKGRVAEGLDADLCLFTDDWQLTDVWARGSRFMRGGEIIRKGNFEQ